MTVWVFQSLSDTVHETHWVGTAQHLITSGRRPSLSAPGRRSQATYRLVLPRGWEGRRRPLVEAGPETAQCEDYEAVCLEYDDENVLDGVEEQTVAEHTETEAVET